jgi:hypothetical protein
MPFAVEPLRAPEEGEEAEDEPASAESDASCVLLLWWELGSDGVMGVWWCPAMLAAELCEVEEEVKELQLELI